ncbi:MAG: amino acid ABC transporter ATP-binding protein [Planctomycetes bacterium]|nr:amino acid ABC transporter ATP-binding protein [Planctomycetota bacterium]
MIRVENLVKRHGAVEVLRGVTLEVCKGAVAGIIGPSGSGKSTLLRCINALEPFDAGRIAVDSVVLEAGQSAKAPASLLRQLRRRVGMVFQQFNLFPHLTALENVMCGPLYVLRMPRPEAAERARALLARVGLEDKVHQKPATLSGGQQQRVAIARALANEPEAILFDEPTSALDPRMTAEVLAVMADLASTGQTMLVVSHAMAFVRRSAQTVHVLDEGRMVESGPPAQIFEDPQQAATRELLAHAEA